MMVILRSPKPLIGNQLKHQLILLSILLLSSPVNGHPKGKYNLYRWETSYGYKWVKFGEIDTHPHYQGDVENGRQNGVGIMTT